MLRILKNIWDVVFVTVFAIFGLIALLFSAVVEEPESAAILWFGILPACAGAVSFYVHNKTSNEIAENQELTAYNRQKIEEHTQKVARRNQENEQAKNNQARKRRLKSDVTEVGQRVQLLEAMLPDEAGSLQAIVSSMRARHGGAK